MNTVNKQVKTALVTGAGRRIGAAIARHLHEAGCHVIIHCHQSLREASALASSLNEKRENSASVVVADLAEKDSAVYLIGEACKTGRLDILVNNASVFRQSSPGKTLNEDWPEMFRVNVQVPYELSMAAYPYLAEMQGVIVNIADIHGEKPLKGYAVYCQTKAALIMQTKALAREFAPKVRVNAVSPGAIIWPEEKNSLNFETKQHILERIPLRKHGSPECIASAVFAQAENVYVTGQIWSVDGGRGLT